MSCRVIVLVLCLAVAVLADIQTRKFGPKIVGGRTTDITVVPYQVSLLLNHWHICGGAIIDPSWILTAAHCLRRGTAGNYSIRAGSSMHYYGGVLIQVEKIIRHPLFEVTAPNNYDVALLKLEEALTISKKIRIIRLTDFEPKRGDQLLVSGWGFFQEEGPYPDNLQTAVIPVVSKSKCNDTYIYSRPVTESMICAGFAKGGKGSCKGDSGGPVVFNNKLVGVVSWGKGCARRNAPAVYANVAKIKTWVDQIFKMENNV